MTELPAPLVQANDTDPRRQAIRARCLESRAALSATERHRHDAAICAGLRRHFADPPAPIVGFCWPVRGEPDVRPAVEGWLASGAAAALPRSDQTTRTLRFVSWRPGAAMVPGAFAIPEPQGGAPVVPGCLLVPMLAFDAGGYRLGYGAGFFDRTLGDWQPRPLLIGIAYELSRTDSVLPQAHDIPVDWIATEAGVVAARREKR